MELRQLRLVTILVVKVVEMRIVETLELGMTASMWIGSMLERRGTRGKRVGNGCVANRYVVMDDIVGFGYLGGEWRGKKAVGGQCWIKGNGRIRVLVKFYGMFAGLQLIACLTSN